MRTTRSDLHVIAAHILGRRRWAVSGHFGLRAAPGGVATPAFGPAPEVLRLAGATLVREIGTESRSTPLHGATLAALAAFAEVDLGADFPAGPGTPALLAPEEPLQIDDDDLDALYGWFDLGWRVLDAVTTGAGPVSGWSTTQLWPEHFDVGTGFDLGAGAGVNLGFSPGDAFSDEPYAYVGPWGPERPGAQGYWNAPFGAVMTRSAGGDAAAYVAFLTKGLGLLGVN